MISLRTTSAANRHRGSSRSNWHLPERPMPRPGRVDFGGCCLLNENREAHMGRLVAREEGSVFLVPSSATRRNGGRYAKR